MLKTCHRLLAIPALIFIFGFIATAQTEIRDAKAPVERTAVEARNELTGRFTDGADFVVYFEQTEYGLALRPALWTATQLLKQTGNDQFVVADRPARRVWFERDAKGQVIAVKIEGMEGEGLELKRAGRTLLPVELLLSGQGRAAANGFLAAGVKDAGRFLKIGERVLNSFPSKSKAVVDFLSEVVKRFPPRADVYSLLGYAQVAAGARRAAVAGFRRAFQIDPSNKGAVSGLARLSALPAAFKDGGAGWKLPFPLATVFEKPSPAEIRAVEIDWQTRDLSVRDVREVARGEIKFGQAASVVRIISHTVHGFRHYGAIIMPADAKPGCCPVIVEAKGVSWNYFPLELEKLHAPRMMAGAQVIYVVPSFRGELLIFDGKNYQSEGDRTDALDGATDDAVALLNAVLQTTPEADAERICAFGHSRGGTVALLLGIRDARIGCVVNWAGPTDWFELMGTGGWSEQELYGEGIRTRATPSETGGQRVERFLLKAIEGREDLRAVRRRMLASSPLYFAGRLRQVQLHYGEEDSSVPVRNGRRLAAELKGKRPATTYETYFYPGAGHDTDRIKAPNITREYFKKFLKIK